MISAETEDAPPASLPAGVGEPMAQEVQMVAVERIRVLNPRSRNKKVFAEIIENIAAIGLKRPITVAIGGHDAEGARYDLVCGQGRLEAYRALGEAEIPAILIEAAETDRYLMSLVENLARRQHSPAELLSAVVRLSDRGYSAQDIATKTNHSPTYIRDILVLLRNGEERLIHAVEKAQMPLKIATARRIVERRRSFGARFRPPDKRTSTPARTAHALVNAYETEVRRQKLLIKKAELNEQRLLFLVTALKTLLRDENFLTLLRAENLNSLPKYLADEIKARGGP